MSNGENIRLGTDAALPPLKRYETEPRALESLIDAWMVRSALLRAHFAPVVLQALAATRGRLRDRCLWVDPDEKAFWLDAPEGRFPARAWVPRGSGRVPAVLLLHGSNRCGSRLGMYPIIADYLMRYGIFVLTIDLPGFGASLPQEPPWHLEQFTNEGAVSAAIDYLGAHPRVEPAQIHLLGHSLGANLAMNSALLDSRVRSVLALGPTRRVQQRWITRERYVWAARFAHDRRLRPAPPESLIQEVSKRISLEFRIDDWGRPGHPPLLLLDCELEDQRDQSFLSRLAARIAPPVEYKTIPEADHYLNTTGLGPVIAYDRRAIETFVLSALDWIERQPREAAHAG